MSVGPRSAWASPGTIRAYAWSRTAPTSSHRAAASVACCTVSSYRPVPRSVSASR
ncbi:hypothetical protein ACGF5O_09365 [Streptomyces sp. NPDC048291]|uniref:hypothetical protein n=1 Tax=Streptomyces sp. NPDC048291 TaxID=3365530 RepID=UPI00371ABE1B